MNDGQEIERNLVGSVPTPLSQLKFESRSSTTLRNTDSDRGHRSPAHLFAFGLVFGPTYTHT